MNKEKDNRACDKTKRPSRHGIFITEQLVEKKIGTLLVQVPGVPKITYQDSEISEK